MDVAAEDARKFLSETQYSHAVQQFETLATGADPRRSQMQDVRAVEDFFELRDKGGVLGRVNLRVYFAVLEDRRMILVLGCDKKEQDGKMATHMRIRMRNRLRIAKDLLKDQGHRKRRLE